MFWKVRAMPGLRDRMGLEAGDGASPAKAMVPGGRAIDAGEDVEDGGFAGAVGADEADEFAGEQVQREVIDGAEAAELHGEGFDDQERGGIAGGGALRR